VNEIIREFLVETYESLAQLDIDLVTLEKDPIERQTLGARGPLGRIFRTLHTIKGTAGFLNLTKLQAVSHSAENLLSRLRSGELAFTPEIATALLGAVDAVRAILNALEASEQEGDGDYSNIIHALDLLTAGGTPGSGGGSKVRFLTGGTENSGTAAAPDSNPSLPSQHAPTLIRPPSGPVPAPQPRNTAPIEQPAPPIQPPVAASPPPLLPPPPARPTPTLPLQAATVVTSSRHVGMSPHVQPPSAPAATEERPRMPSPTPAIVPPHSPPVPPPASMVDFATPAPAATSIGSNSPAAESTESRSPIVSDSSIRVDVGLLDKLMTLVGELVLARNQIMQYSATQEDSGFLGTVQRLNLLTTELQAGVMKTRMQPIGNVWAKFPRIVRDLALACGKQVAIEMDGQETELDKTIVEAIRDPLTHMVRNAVDHGFEAPAQRLAAGKPAEGRLHLHAFHEGGKVIIEISDDGGGIDPQRVKDKAINNKIISPEHAARMSERELINLVFLPGFSTADRITHFSGRGVGMDVVRTNIEKIGGTVDIISRLGRGTTVKMKIPLTLAIIPALTITTGGDRYAIPQVSLLELVRLEGEQLSRGLELIHGAPVYRLRGNLLPLVYLDQQLQIETTRRERTELNIVVLQADDRQFGLIVDDIHDTEEIVVKPLQKQLKGVSAFAGATIMGDGRVALILDVLGLAQRSGVVSGIRERSHTEKTTVAEKAGDIQTVLLFSTPGGGRMALPLAQVARLEELPRSTIERVGQSEVVQYRGEILPLLRISRLLGRRKSTNGKKASGKRPPRDSGLAASPTDQDEKLHVVVCASEDRRVGLVVGRILDIVETSISTRSRSSRPGVLFNAVVQERVTEFVDIEGIMRMGSPQGSEITMTGSDGEGVWNG
jgi:two-component system chemotaxis sensor kinase CheA